MNNFGKRLWAEINLDNLIYNFRTVKNLLPPQTLTCCVIKADAYGHSARVCIKTLLDSGCRFFAVSCIEEALAVREYCEGVEANILILGYTSPSQAEKLVAGDIIQTELICITARTCTFRIASFVPLTMLYA